MVSVLGFSFSGNGQNAALAFVPLKDWDERDGADHTAQAVAGRAFGALMGVKDAFIFPLSPPPIPELGTASGFSFRLQDRGGLGHDALLAARNQLLGMAVAEQAADRPAPRGARGCAAAAARHRPRQGECARRRLRCDQCRDLDRARLELCQRLSECRPAAAGDRAGRRAGAHAARRPAAHQRSEQPRPAGAAVGLRQHPLGHRADADGALQRLPVDAHLRPGGARLQQRRGDRRDGAARRPAAPGHRLRMDRRCRARRSSPDAQVFVLLGFSLLAIFLALAALYESWSIPFAVILVVPLGVLGVVLAGHLGRPGQRHLLQGRPDHDHRPVGQECGADHRVRQGPAGARAQRGRCGARGGPPALPADPDDVDGLHPRRAAAGDRQRRRLGRPARDRHRRDGRHDLGHRCWRCCSCRSSSSSCGVSSRHRRHGRTTTRGIGHAAAGRRQGMTRSKPSRVGRGATRGALLLTTALALAGCGIADSAPRSGRRCRWRRVIRSPASWHPGGRSPMSTGRPFSPIPRLQRLIALALDSNRDLRVAALAIEQARAQLQVRRADLLPTVGAGVDGQPRRRAPAARPATSTAPGCRSAPGSSTCSAACAA